MSAKLFTKAIWGCPESIRPLRNQPQGRIKIRFRNNDFARPYVKSENSITEHYILDMEDYTELSGAINKNLREEIK